MSGKVRKPRKSASAGESRRFLQGPFGDALTEVLTALYVFVGVVLLAIASRLGIFASAPSLRTHGLLLLAIGVCAMSAALVTFFTRRQVHATELFFTPDPNRFTPTDWLAATHGILFVLLGLAALTIPPASAEPRYALMLVVMVTALGLNTYFIPYWRNTAVAPSDPVGKEAMKLQHAEWSGMFANACLGFLVAMGGAVYALFAVMPQLAAANRSGTVCSPLGVFLDGLLLAYCVLAPTTVWLLRPMYVTMVRVRMRVNALEKREFVAKHGPAEDESRPAD